MRHLIFYSATNSKGKSDATGAFIPEAINLIDYLTSQTSTKKMTMVPIKTHGKSRAEKRRQVESALDDYKDGNYNSVYFLCHGYKTGMQYGYNWESGANLLVKKLTEYNPGLESIIFYSCSVAKDTNNFCEWTLEALKKYSNSDYLQVFGHWSKGHTTKNPHIKIYTNKCKPFLWSQKDYASYNQLIKSDKKEAMRMLRDSKTDLRSSLPWLPKLMIDNGFTWGIK